MIQKVISALGYPAAYNPAIEISYGYDSTRNVIGRTWTGTAFGNKPVQETFTYDALDRLETWTPTGPIVGNGSVREYEYDVIGNLKTVSEGSQVVYQAAYGWANCRTLLPRRR